MRLNGTARGLLIIAAVAAVITVLLELRVVTLARLGWIVWIAVVVVTAYVVFLLWRQNREAISMWPRRAQWVFYGSAGVVVADLVAYRFGPPRGTQLMAFVAILALCGLAMFRTWREQHRYV